MSSWSPSDFSPQQKALAILPKPFALLSILGSACILHHALQSPQRRRSVQFQILVGLSICDMIGSFFFAFLGTWPIPASVNDEAPSVFMASGTEQSCRWMGWVAQSTVDTPIYSGALAIYYYLVSCRGWNETRIKKVSPWFHIVPLTIGWGTAIAGLPLDLYHSVGIWCWITAGPENYDIYRWAFMYGPVWISMTLTILAMFAVYRHVQKQEAAASKYMQPGEARRNQHSVQVAKQGITYCGAFLLTWSLPTVTRAVQAINPDGSAPLPLIYLSHCIFLPSQGFFNFLVFLRPRLHRHRKENPDASLFASVTSVIARSNSVLTSRNSSTQKRSSTRMSKTSTTLENSPNNELTVAKSIHAEVPKAVQAQDKDPAIETGEIFQDENRPPKNEEEMA